MCIKKIIIFPLFVCLALFAFGQNNPVSLTAPGRNIRVAISLNKAGTPSYTVSYNGKKVIGQSKLGLKIKDLDFTRGLEWVSTTTSSQDDTWNTVWGEEATIRDQYNEAVYALQTKAGQKINIRFRAFDNGVGFRYEIPEQAGLTQLVIQDEITEFQMQGDHTAWWSPGDWDSNEHTFTTSKLSQVDATKYQNDREPFNQHITNIHALQTPMTMRAADGTHIVIAEAALIDYGTLHLIVDPKTKMLRAFVIPTADSTIKSINRVPFNTPWRVILINRQATDLLANRTILNLNAPCALTGDLSWIKPQKYVGIWWEMHVGRGSWDYSGSNPDHKPTGKHAGNTANVKRYIDFAAKNGFSGVLVEGWNEGWEQWFDTGKEDVFDFTKPYPDFDIAALSKYAAEKNVQLISHHETSAAVPSYERQMDAAYAFMLKYGINSVKTGYVGHPFPKGEWHDSQYMINHYLRVMQRTAQNKIMLDAHEPVRPSGLQRTYPNFMSCEAGRGMEYNAWSKGNAPEHECILPFTRLLGGPMDYTPGIFETRMNVYDPNKKEIVHTTVAKQLALYLTLYSPLQMAADLPENYEKRPDVFQFIRDVPVDWSESRYIHASIGDFLTIARKQKGSSNWFIGSITDENPRTLSVKLDFLDANRTYQATIYADGADAHYINNPYPVAISTKTVRKGDTLVLKLAASGGCAIAIK